MERARGGMRRSDASGAAELWKPLVKAHYTLLDYFERGGKRYLVAVENAPRVPERGLAALSRREQQVVSAAATGRTSKVIAYELGLSNSTVRVLLARAAKRVGAESSRELIAIYRAHQNRR
jgi:DNA-binding NarL/FixJ family response regulator